MNPEITLNDYEKIGTMETALSEHADEAFFELSPDGQKIAEKIFKCLTETDRENREIRRAMTVEKLCAVAEADFAEVAAVIEAFRREGRTFLMPPPEVPLSENTLIDISHESLIRKWERLKNWVEEEGQSARTYRRLAEDALLHQQGKVGFWSDPELKDALEWRENFKPNETWAQLYKETGERQFKASFVDSMQYLDESAIRRDEEIAADKRQQNALKSFAAKLRWAVIGLLILFLASMGVAAYAFYLRADAVNLNEKLAAEKKVAQDSLEQLKESQKQLNLETQDKDKALEEVEAKKNQLIDSLKIQEEATNKAEDEKTRADEQTKLAKLSELETQKALERQKQLSAEAEAAKNNAIEKQKEAEIAQKEAEVARKQAEDALAEAKSTSDRVEINRQALVFLEQGEFLQALPLFKQLLAKYEDNTQEMSQESRTDGKWWALHNLGIVNSKLNEFKEAEKFYKTAIDVLGELQEKTQSQNSSRYFQFVSYQTRAEVNRNKVATLRRLAQLYRAWSEYVTDDNEWRKYLLLAIEKYNRLIEIQEAEYRNKEQPAYMVEIYVELAECLSDSPEEGDYYKAKKLYEKTAGIYEALGNLGKQVEVLKKHADAARSANYAQEAFALLSEAIEIQEDVMHLSPINLEIADTYARLAEVHKLSEKQGYGGDYYEGYDKPSPYAKLSELINKVNYAVNKTDYLSPEDVIKLANNYVENGKCRKAEKLYSDAIERLNQKSRQGETLRSSLGYLYLYVALAELYQNVLHDDQNAQIYFDKFAADSEKSKPGSGTSVINRKLFEKAGDFYFSKKDYPQAGKFYEYTLQKIEDDKRSNEVLERVSPIPPEDETSMLIKNKVEVIVKTARISKEQKKFEEEEAKYSDAVILASSSFQERNNPINKIILRVSVLINQADFYERIEKKKKALDIYSAIENTLNELDTYDNAALQAETNVEEIPALKGIVYKKLGDFNRDNIPIAVKFYRKAVNNLQWYKVFSSKNKYAPYFKDNSLNAKYYSDLAEAYEAWMSLRGVEFSPGDKKAFEEARDAAARLKLVEQSPCKENE